MDIESIDIDMNKSPKERMSNFLRQIKNPYLFKVGDIAVKVVYKKTDVTLQHQVESLIQSNLAK